ncbi:MAG: threonine/serine dehydratase [Planctomycetota bacterium]|nr:MAG: threonine/serine dehydratase [Planctomycetota bacterium]
MTAAIQDIRIAEAAERLRGVIRRTPLVPFPSGDPRVELRLKLECLQECNAFKARGAWNQMAQLTPEQRAAGVVTVSSGNHGKAVAWAAQRAGVRATICMPADAYPNKIQACRDFGAEVVLCGTRQESEREVAKRVAAGAVLVHPYDSARTIEGQGTVGLEIAEDWPEVELVIIPVGGGGLVSGCALAFRGQVQVFGVEPEGAPDLTLALQTGRPVPLAEVRTVVQGLCPPSAGKLPLEICKCLGVRVFTLDDGAILAAQARLVREGGWEVEPAGAAAAALVFAGRLPAELFQARARPLKVAVVVSGGNPDPAQLAALRAST